ncbi:MAG TPA: type I DNA topoisomerase [Flavobacteriaceae bacterium]|nr:type I DNA topoisomerase [Flavobacteriaceae bacterium]
MAKNIVIVESPAKAKTIERFLGKEYHVTSSYGHIADLPSNELGVDTEGNFDPKYIVPNDKKKLVSELKSLTKDADMVWLASDEDREGEAIAWHLVDTLNLEEDKTKRIVFHEITESAILNAIKNPRGIDYNLVNAQQARRVLDRLVGYELSPVLWRKVKGGLSAGRVQSVAVRLIVERERAIEGFTPVGSYRVDAEFKTKEGNVFKAKLPRNFNSKEEAEKFLQQNIKASYKIGELTKRPGKKSPAPPFTTSTLQQEASRKLGFSVGRTMGVAQRLYEAGLITYMRTDSVNLSNQAKNATQKAINKLYGEAYSKPRNYKGKSKGAQEAHEAIRPTNIGNAEIRGERDQVRLYDLIWKRTVASQMSDAQLERTVAHVEITDEKDVVLDKHFVARGEMIKFDGFLKVYLEGTDVEDEEQDGMLPQLTLGDVVQNEIITATERFTRAPYRFTEASLVKQLEELGIGRPSTYAPTISTIIKRNYVEKGNKEGAERKYVQFSLVNDAIKEQELTEMVGVDRGKLMPTDIGMIVTDFLVEHFENVLDYNFTARVEQQFDDIAEGKEDWKSMMREFYKAFQPNVEDVKENADRESGERILGKHPESGKPVLVRLGRYGPMAQIGAADDEDKKFASLRPNQQLHQITFEEALDLFKLPKALGEYEGEDVESNHGRYGPYVRHGSTFISLPKGMDPLDVTIEKAIELIEEKKKADAPIYYHDDLPVQKGVGRFGPYLKWNDMFINVNKKYDFDNLSDEDIVELIEDRKRKEKEKLLVEWKEEGIRIEKARWKRFNLIKGKVKVELPKETEVDKITLEEAQKMIEAAKPKKRGSRKKRSNKKKK